MTDAEIVQNAMSVRCAVDEKPERLDPLGFSFTVSSPLLMILSMRQVDGDLEMSNFQHQVHHYIRLNDGRVLDATIDQFAEALNRESTQAIYLGPPLACHNVV